MNILIAGVNGNIGSFLYSQLEQEFSILAMDYSEGPIKGNFSQLDLEI